MDVYVDHGILEGVRCVDPTMESYQSCAWKPSLKKRKIEQLPNSSGPLRAPLQTSPRLLHMNRAEQEETKHRRKSDKLLGWAYCSAAGLELPNQKEGFAFHM